MREFCLEYIPVTCFMRQFLNTILKYNSESVSKVSGLNS